MGLLKRIFSIKKEESSRILSSEDIECRFAEISLQNKTSFKGELTKAALLYISIVDMAEKGYRMNIEGYKGPWYRRSKVKISIDGFYEKE